MNTLVARKERLTKDYPDYCTVSEVARVLGMTRGGVKAHKRRIKHIEVDGMTLYHRGALAQYASTFAKANGNTSRLAVVGLDVERLQKICVVYYRRHYDDSPPDLLALAKRLAKL